MDHNRAWRPPLSLADLKRKRDQEQSSASRPVFLNKQQRQLAASTIDNDEHKRKRGRFEYRDSTASNRISKRQREPSVTKQAIAGNPEAPNQRERDEIRRHYMRDHANTYVSSSRSRGSAADRSRFRFDWDDDDDTTLQDDDDTRHLRDEMARKLAETRSRPMVASLHRPGWRRPRTGDYDARHWSQKQREDMTPRDWRIFREDYLISMRSSGTNPPHPARNWDEMNLPSDIIRLVRDVARYDRPSPIQMAAIPIGIAQRDCIGLAETGSGKTAAFVLPMLVHICKLPRMTPRIAAGGPYALILAPTRELALQIETEATKFARPLGFRVVHIIGGQQLDVQVSELESGCEIVVCTPGRMVDLLSKQMAALANCNYLILDEADRMIDMGFEPQVSEVLNAMPVHQGNSGRRRQTFMFSATMSPIIERLARTYLHEPVVISVGETGKAADNVTQRVEYFLTENRRRERFIELLETVDPPILVFVNTRGGCEMVQRYIDNNSSVRAVFMHSGKSQEQREATLDGFKSGRYKVLIATDVVGRGIDIKGVRNVINFELPKNIETYIHRIGRTGRAGEKGTAWSLATEADVDLFAPLYHMLQQSKANVPREISKVASSRGGIGMRAITD